MPYLSDHVLDGALSTLAQEADTLHICASEGGDHLGTATVKIGSPTGRTPNGRKVTIAKIEDGSVTGTGTASHWMIKGGGKTLAVGTLSRTQYVTQGNSFSLPAFDIGMPGSA